MGLYYVVGEYGRFPYYWCLVTTMIGLMSLISGYWTRILNQPVQDERRKPPHAPGMCKSLPGAIILCFCAVMARRWWLETSGRSECLGSGAAVGQACSTMIFILVPCPRTFRNQREERRSLRSTQALACHGSFMLEHTHEICLSNEEGCVQTWCMSSLISST